MKIEIIKIASTESRKNTTAIDKLGRLYIKDKETKWMRFRTFCTRYENREYFEALSIHRKVFTGKIYIEVGQ